METSFIESHIGVSKPNLYAMATMEHILKKREISIEIPHGQAWLRDDTYRPIVLIAYGAGFSYACSILLTVVMCYPKRKVAVY